MFYCKMLIDIIIYKIVYKYKLIIHLSNIYNTYVKKYSFQYTPCSSTVGIKRYFFTISMLFSLPIKTLKPNKAGIYTYI